MYFNDTATSLVRAEARPNLGRQMAYNKTQTNGIREGIIVKVGPAEALENSAFVYVLSTKETIKVEAPLSNGASAVSSTGQYQPYFVGDKVLVAFLYGDPSRACIVGRIHDQAGVSEYMLQEGSPVPKMGAVLPSGQKVRPNHISVDVHAFQEGGLVSYTSYPMLLI